jgi:hypothetical protein
VAVVRDTTQDDGTSQFATMHAMAPSLKMEVYPVNMTPVKSSAASRSDRQNALKAATFERAMIRERVLAGIAGAHDHGTQLGCRRLEDTDAKKVVAIRRARKKRDWHPPGARVPAR